MTASLARTTFGQVRDGLRALDLGDQQRIAAGGAQQAPCLVHVGAVLRERHGQIIDLERSGNADVLAVLVRERTRRQAAALAVDALVVAELAPHQHFGVYAGSVDRLHLQTDLAVVQEQDVADAHVRGQLLVGDADRLLVARLHGERGVEGELGAVDERDLAALEALHADLRALQVAEHPHVAACPPGGIPDHFHAPGVVRQRAMGEIHADHIDACAHHVADDLGIVRRRPEGGDDLGATQYEAHEALCSRMSTAGSFLPSTNSRNAPPPVEM